MDEERLLRLVARGDRRAFDEWLAFSLLVPTPRGTAGEVVNWMVFFPGTAASTGTAWALLATGTVVYAVAGPRR